MKRAFVLLTVLPLLGAALGAEPSPEAALQRFQQWAAEHKWRPNKSRGESFQSGFVNFVKNEALAQEAQALDEDAEYGSSVFSAVAAEDFRNNVLMRIPMSPGPAGSEREADLASGNDTVPEALDWRELGSVGPVRNQGYCGSCWAFSAVAAIEGAEYITNGRRAGQRGFVELSVEQIVECSDNNYACFGGWNDKAIEWVQQAGGIAAERDYPYTRLTEPDFHVICLANQTFNATCPIVRDPPCTRFCNLKCEVDLKEKHPAHAKVSGLDELPHNEEAIKRHLALHGPLSIAINADWLQFYRRGIMSLPAWFCSHNVLNHAVLLVGYGTAKNRRGKETPFWIVRNSWGAKWGEQGFFRIRRGAGTCGVNKKVVGARVETKPDSLAAELLDM